MLLLGQKYTYADGDTTNVYIFRHGRVTRAPDGNYPVLKEESKTEIRNSAEEISCDSDTSQNDRIFYLVNDGSEKNSKRFEQTSTQIVKGLKNRKSCNSEISQEAISVKDSRNPNDDDLQKVWGKITDDSLKYYNKIFVLSAEVIKALLKPNTEQCPPENAPCFMEKWQDVHQALEESKDEHNNQYSREEYCYKPPKDYLYAMILHFQLPRITKPDSSILSAEVETISIDSEPPPFYLSECEEK